MKYVVVLGDGMADKGCAELGGLTPLQYACTPNMDRIASTGTLGLVKTVPEGYAPGSDVANLSIMGYDPVRYYTGRSPLEAVSMGIELGPEDVAFRCNLVTLSGDEPYSTKIMLDYCAGEISSEEARLLVADIDKNLGSQSCKFYSGISYRHLMVWRGGPWASILTPPHDISGKCVAKFLPQGAGAQELYALMDSSYRLLSNHAVNRNRLERGLNPANSIWLWGQGKKPALPEFSKEFGVEGAVISAVDLIKGIGICAGMRVIDVEGATGTINTNFEGKARAALEALTEVDFVYLHVEAPDEASHQGDLEGKIKAIEAIDKLVLGCLLDGLDVLDKYRIMVLPDHPTPLDIKTHSAEPVPFAIMEKKTGRMGAGRTFNENTAAASGMYVSVGHSLMKYFLYG
ncbi:MAG: cofactor-independent phosphoglycerate mutase [Peptococcaceae bacterium]|nr:cofactor-independent phosphoglycerate mutase [Peptococcaceae bacterium]